MRHIRSRTHNSRQEKSMKSHTNSRSKRMNSRPETSVRNRVRWSWLQTSAFLKRRKHLSRITKIRWLLKGSFFSVVWNHRRATISIISKSLTCNSISGAVLYSLEKVGGSFLKNFHWVPSRARHDLWNDNMKESLHSTTIFSVWIYLQTLHIYISKVWGQ